MKSEFERTGKLQRKIDVYRVTDSGMVYVHSTNWHARCRDAVASAKSEKPDHEFRAFFVHK